MEDRELLQEIELALDPKSVVPRERLCHAFFKLTATASLKPEDRWILVEAIALLEERAPEFLEEVRNRVGVLMLYL